MSRIMVSARVVPRPSARRELLQALLSWAGSVRAQPGVVWSNVYEDAEAAAAFGVETQWADAAALEEHLRSDEFGALLGAFELLAQPAQVLVTTPVQPYGDDPLAAIQRLREGLWPPAEDEGHGDASGE